MAMTTEAQRSRQQQGLYDPVFEHDACASASYYIGGSAHAIVRRLAVLENLEHRGACGCDPETGDGAGILIQQPDRFWRREAGRLGLELPAAGLYAVGNVFLSTDPAQREWQARRLEELVAAEGQHLLGWRDVPHHPEAIGHVARAAMPHIRQVFVGAAPGLDQDVFERKLYVLRREMETRRGPGFATSEPVDPDDRFPGMLKSTRSSLLCDLTTRSSRRSRSCTRATARTRSAPGTSRTRSASWRTTARSTRCAETATTCARARARCARASSATTWASSTRS
jgi:hypothetical protein